MPQRIIAVYNKIEWITLNVANAAYFFAVDSINTTISVLVGLSIVAFNIARTVQVLRKKED